MHADVDPRVGHGRGDRGDHQRRAAGSPCATAVANAAADAECPDGNDDDVGGSSIVW